VIRKIALAVATAVATTSCAAMGIGGGCDGTEVIAYFEQVGDLVEASNVQSSDVTIGSIQKIELNEQDWTAEVTMCVEANEKVSADARAVVRTTSLLGEKFVDLQPVTPGPPFLADGAIIETDRTSKATELEDIFAQLGAILGSGNLEDLNAFTASQAEILGTHADDLKEVLARLRDFTDLLVSRKGDIAASMDSFDNVSRTVLNSSSTLERFLESFGQASGVLADQKEGLQDLLASLQRFSDISLKLLDATEEGLTKQFRDLRPVLRTLVNNADKVEETIVTLATFSDWFPETMPGDYLQLDVCQALETTTQGTTCPQSDKNDDPRAAGTAPEAAPDDGSGGAEDIGGSEESDPFPSTDLESILERPLGDES
jgi:phospholipid/cholesterol/gamma-HCH transport system substrate-binding protein